MATLAVYCSAIHDVEAQTARIAYIVQTDEGKVIEQAAMTVTGCIFPSLGDYAAVKMALRAVERMRRWPGIIFTDSKLVFMQMHNQWLEGPAEHAGALILEAQRKTYPLLDRLTDWRLRWIAPEENLARALLTEGDPVLDGK